MTNRDPNPDADILRAGVPHPVDVCEGKLETTTVVLDVADSNLRPQFLSAFIGQEQIKANLSVFINAARDRNEAMDHLFLIGPPGLGKTTLAAITAHELGAEFKVTSAPALDKPKDLAGILSTISERTVFFIDEIHRLKPAIEEMLYIAMEDYELDWIIGAGAAARTVRIPVPKFTLVGATTKAGMVSSPLIGRFGIVQRFGFYGADSLAEIIHRSAGILGVTVTDEAAAMMAACARGTPRVANRLLRRMRDFAQIGTVTTAATAGTAAGTTAGTAIGTTTATTADKTDAPAVTVTPAIVREGLRRLEVDALGLEKYDREILLSIIENFGGGPVGAETLAISIGEAADTLEDYYEPFLIQCGLLQRTGRGRMVTEKAYAHLGVEPRTAGRDSIGGQRLLF